MRLGDLLVSIDLTHVDIPPEFSTIEIERITADSREVEPGSLFVAIDGTSAKGSDFIAQAIGKGARVIVSSNSASLSATVHGQTVLHLGVAEPRQALAHLAQRFFGAQPTSVAAITGTNGKTSTAEFLRQFWQMQGKPAASLGTLGLRSDAIKLNVPALTTPDPVQVAQILNILKSHHVENVAIEASSHGLDQYRLDGVTICAAAFSNLTRDHLDYHENLDAYRTAKLRLFQDILPEGGIAAVNADMDAEAFAALRRIARYKHFDLRTTGVSGETLQRVQALPQADGLILKLDLYGLRLDDIHLPLIGLFQADNAMLAAALAWEDRDSAFEICKNIARLRGVPGRCEHVATLNNGATVFVDYAHTPDALQNLLRSLRPHARGRLILVFGAGGNRDKGKRPLMGVVAKDCADVSIVTDDNPRNEIPAIIRKEIMQACPDALEIGDRHSAIQSALKCARDGDIVVIAGKGHESGQTINGVTHKFHDADVIRALAGVTDNITDSAQNRSGRIV